FPYTTLFRSQGKELADWLKANEETMIKIKGNNLPAVGYPTPEYTSFPTYFGVVLPYGGIIIPGVYQRLDGSGNLVYDEQGNPVYEENLGRSEEHTSELQSRENLVCRLLLEK